MLEQVEAQRAYEQKAVLIERQLGAMPLPVPLPSEERTALIRVTIEYRDAMREAFSSKSGEARNEFLEALRKDYAQTVSSIVSGENANMIIRLFSRYPGSRDR